MRKVEDHNPEMLQTRSRTDAVFSNNGEVAGDKENLKCQLLLEKVVDQQYGSLLNHLRRTGLYDYKNPPEGLLLPDLPTIVTVLKQTLSPFQLAEIRAMQVPRLQVEVPYSLQRYIEALKNFNLVLIRYFKPFIGDIALQVLAASDKQSGVYGESNVINWRTGIVEGIPESPLLPGERGEETLEDRIQWFKREKQARGVETASPRNLILMMMFSLMRLTQYPMNNFLEKNGTWNMMGTEEPFTNRLFANKFVAGIDWDDEESQVRLISCGIDLAHYRARFRTSVVVDIPNRQRL